MSEIDVPDGILEQLRALRLWHWLAFKAHRMYADGKGISEAYRVVESKVANEHLGFVQTLNVFFPLGDTAERDAAK